MTESQINKVKKLYQIGIPMARIAKMFNVTENTIFSICKKVKRL